MAKSNPGIELRQINPTGKSLLIFRNLVKPRNQKYFASRLTQIRCISFPVLAHRGAFRDRHGRWAWDAVDAAASGAQRGCRAGWRKACERSPSERTRVRRSR